MLCFAMPTDLSFFRYEIRIFCDLMELRRFAHRKHSSSQSDAGMNLAFFKFDRIIGTSKIPTGGVFKTYPTSDISAPKPR